MTVDFIGAVNEGAEQSKFVCRKMDLDRNTADLPEGGKQMRGRKSILSVVLLSALAALLLPIFSISINDADELDFLLSEWDKVCMGEADAKDWKDYVHVVLEETTASEKKSGKTRKKAGLKSRYSWEKPLKNENVEKLFLKNSRKIGDELNDSSERTVTIPEGENQLIDQFTRTYLDGYLSREMPDLGVYYDLSNEVRKENRLLIEAYIYEHAISGAHTVDGYDREFFITKVTPRAEGVDEIIFYLVDVLHTDNGDEDSGTWFVADIGLTEEGYKFLNLWIESPEFEMMQNRWKKDYLKNGISPEREQVQRDIYDWAAERMDSGYEIPLMNDPYESPDKAANDVSLMRRRTTIAYDRETVAKKAKKYAYKYNDLFVPQNGSGGDCTNYVSQCMWQRAPAGRSTDGGKITASNGPAKGIMKENILMKRSPGWESMSSGRISRKMIIRSRREMSMESVLRRRDMISQMLRSGMSFSSITGASGGTL